MLLLSVLMVACKGRAGSGDGLSNSDMVGVWETLEVKVELKSYRNTSKDSSFTITPLNADPNVRTAPPTTYINADGSYRDESRDAAGNIVRESKGYWHLSGDTIIMRLASQNDGGIRFHVEQKGNKMKLKNKVDFDADGQQDDAMKIDLRKK